MSARPNDDPTTDLSDELAELRGEVDELRRREELYRRAIAQAGAVPYVVDYRANRYTFMGDGIEELTGWPAEEWDPSMWAGIIVESDTQGEQKGLTATEAGERTRAGEFSRWRCDLLIRRRDGTLRWISDGSIEIFGGDGQSIGSIGLLQDIDDRRRAEEERRQHELEVEVLQSQRLESLGVLAGGIAHDFNNLLVGIMGNVSLALDEAEEDSPLRLYLDQIAAASSCASDLTKQMLAFSGKGRFVLQHIDLSTAVREIGALLESAHSRRATLVYDLADGLPAIEGDAGQLTQVIMNLVINAGEALGDGEGTIAVSTDVVDVTAEELATFDVADTPGGGRYVRLEIRDNGAGMDAETLTHIFDPFFSTKFTGRGLGLAAALGIVRGHHGAIRVTTEPGHGTTFELLFPALEATESAPAQLRAAQPRSAPADARGSALVVDDEDVTRRVAVAMLETLGFSVRAVAGGSDALALFDATERPFDIVLLDLTMPRMDGEEVLAELARRGTTVPVILSSGYDAAELMERLADSRIAAFLQKPYRIDSLRAAVRTAGVLPDAA